MSRSVARKTTSGWLASAVATLLIAAVVAVFVGQASAIPVTSGVLGGFQQDGNQVDNDDPSTTADDAQIDWATSSVNDGDLIRTVDEGGPTTDDIGYQGSSKELKPSDWVCNADGGDDPAKGNILRTYVNTRVADGYIDLAWVRQNIQGEGDVEVNYEFNQQAAPTNTGTSCKITRTAGDLMIEYGFPGGTDAPDIDAYKWQPHAAADVTTNEDGVWVNLNLTSADVKAAVNNTPLADDLLTSAVNDTLGYQSFGEATVKLTALFGNDPNGPCRNFGHLNIRSKSSRSDNATPALQDKLPTTGVNLSSCGSITIKKVDDHQPPQPVQGAVFKLYGSETSTTVLDTCTTTATGLCVFSGVRPGTTYYIREFSVPDGYGGTTDVIGPISVAALQNVDLTSTPVVNPRLTGNVRITKALQDSSGNPVTPDDVSDLNGATFVIYKDANSNGTYQAGEAAKLWPAETSDATCTITAGGACTIGPLPTGSYRLTETAAPSGTNLTAADQAITITAAHTTTAPLARTMTNTLNPLNVTLAKTGPAAVYMGDTFNWIFTVTTTGPKLHNVTITELVSGRCDSAPTRDDALSTGEDDGFLDPNTDSWVFKCPHTIVVGDLALLNASGEFVNVAKAGGTDDFGRTIESPQDDHKVLIVRPSISVDKDVNGGDHATTGAALVVHEGDTVTYTVTITNNANVPMKITDIDDSLFAVLPSDCAGLIGDVLAVGASTSCTYTATATGPRNNVVDVDAVDDVLKDPVKGAANDSDETYLTTIDPSLTVDKSASVETAYGGDTVTYSFLVTNTGDVTLTNITVVDDLLGNIGTIASLAAGASTTLTKTYAVPEGATVVNNHVDACAPDPLFPNDPTQDVCGDDDHELPVINPDLTLDKSVNDDPDDSVTVRVGDDLNYTITITNTGDVELEITGLTDSQHPTLPASCAALIGTVLAPAGEEGDSVSCSYTDTASVDVTNLAVVTAIDTEVGREGEELTRQDDTDVDVIDPRVSIVKTGAALAREGDVVTYTFVVTNTGDVPLVDLVVTDDILGTIGTVSGPLAPGASTTLTKTYTVPAGAADITNVAEVCAEPVPNVGDPVCNDDDHVLDRIHPAITIDKTANPTTVNNGGGPVTYTYVVTNTGDVTLTNVTVTDDILGLIGTIPSLAPGASATLTKTVDVTTASPTRNVGTAVGTDPTGRTVTDDDDAVISVVAGVVFTRGPEPTLPRTGSDIGAPLKAALTLLTLGSAMVVFSRRRRIEA